MGGDGTSLVGCWKRHTVRVAHWRNLMVNNASLVDSELLLFRHDLSFGAQGFGSALV
jgi:hypothetical protein